MIELQLTDSAIPAAAGRLLLIQKEDFHMNAHPDHRPFQHHPIAAIIVKVGWMLVKKGIEKAMVNRKNNDREDPPDGCGAGVFRPSGTSPRKGGAVCA